jgi:hypothetical protein
VDGMGAVWKCGRKHLELKCQSVRLEGRGTSRPSNLLSFPQLTVHNKYNLTSHYNIFTM